MKRPLRPNPDYIRPRFWNLGFGISLDPAAAGWDLELPLRSCKSLILLMIADNCRKLLGEKNISCRNRKSDPGAASEELQTRADSRRKYLIPRLSAHFFKKIKPPIESEI